LEVSTREGLAIFALITSDKCDERHQQRTRHRQINYSGGCIEHDQTNTQVILGQIEQIKIKIEKDETRKKAATRGGWREKRFSQ